MPEKQPVIDRYFLNVSIERALFNSYILIFLATAMVTLLGILGLFNIDKTILKILVNSLIVEVVGGVVALFGTRLLKGSSIIKVRLNLEVPFDFNDLSKMRAKYSIIDPDSGAETEQTCAVYKDDIGLCINLSSPHLRRSVSVVLDIDGATYQGSDWLETRTINLQKI